jgi:outer membrane autotransporter protein
VTPQGQTVAPSVRSTAVPLTPGRDIGFETRWNAWSELTGVNLSDRRYGLDTRNRSYTMTGGLDRQLTPDVVAGLSLGVQNSSGSGFRELMRSSTDGFTVGPYVAVRLSEHWAIDASFNYSQTKSDAQIVVLSGATTLSAYNGQFSVHGQYTFVDWFLRPKVTVTYTRNVSGERDMHGTLLGLPISFTLPASQSNYGLIEGYQEISRLFDLSNGYYAIPYTELGVHYAFERPNAGQILTGDLANVIPTAWSGSLRQGVRVQLPNAALFEASVGYLSLGAPGLAIWEGKVRFSLGF